MPIKFTSKRWFWILLVVSFLWAAMGYHWREADPAQPSLMTGIQTRLGQPFRLLLVPAQFVFGGIEGIAASAIERVTARHDDTANVDQLQERIQNLEARNSQLASLIAKINQRVAGLQIISSAGLIEHDVLEAHFLGNQAGPGTSRITLDKGSMDGIQLGMAVVAPLEQVTVLGRVVAVDQKTCTVCLLTDPQMKVRADIVRDTATPITTEPCLIEGLGNGQMKCTNMNVPQNPQIAPRHGDFVRLVDNAWPASTQFMRIGRIEEVRTRDNQALRYDLRIAPLRPVSNLNTFMIVTRNGS